MQTVNIQKIIKIQIWKIRWFSYKIIKNRMIYFCQFLSSGSKCSIIASSSAECRSSKIISIRAVIPAGINDLIIKSMSNNDCLTLYTLLQISDSHCSIKNQPQKPQIENSTPFLKVIDRRHDLRHELIPYIVLESFLLSWYAWPVSSPLTFLCIPQNHTQEIKRSF